MAGGSTAGGWIRIGRSRPGLERAEACFAGHAFEPHRHDTYAIGVTLQGVQAFRYRGTAERSLPGQLFVLHPDELHDGRAGSEEGFGYRILYVEPRLIRDALDEGRCALPFVRDAVSDDRRLAAAVIPALADLEVPLEDLGRDRIVLDLAEALAAVDPSVARRPASAVHRRAVEQARDFLHANLDQAVASAQLEAVTGLERHALGRHFRAHLGTSPHRYLVMRRLDRARALIRAGAALVDVALSCGFADQSHMTRHFKNAYGISPGRWAMLVGRARAT